MELKRYKYIKNKKLKFTDGQSLVINPNYNYNETFTPGYQYPKTISERLSEPINTSKIQIPNLAKTNITSDMASAPSNFQAPTIQPSRSGSSGAAMGGKSVNPTAMATSAITFTGDVMNAFNAPVKSSQQLQSIVGTSQGSIGGVGFEQQNAIDEGSARSEQAAESGANTMKAVGSGAAMGGTIGMAFGPIGGAIGAVLGGVAGGIFGGAAARKRKQKLMRQIFQAKQQVNRSNVFNRAGAQSQAMQQEYAQKYGDTQDDVLYANKGKDRMKYNKGKVWTPNGYMNDDHNSWVGKGESLLNFDNGTGTLVTKGKVGVDNQPSSVQENDNNVILGNDIDWTNGITFAKQGAPYTARLQAINKQEKNVGKYNKRSSLSDKTKEVYNKQVKDVKQQLLGNLQAISNRQAKQHEFENMNYTHYDKGKINWNDLAETAYTNITPSLQLLSEALRYGKTSKEKVTGSNTYRSNASTAKALQGLAALRYNIYPELQEYRDKLRQAKYTVEQSGGLTAGQKYAARTALYNDYINNASKLYAKVDAQNNAYKTQYYNALMSAGQADREAMINAARYDDTQYRQADAAKRQYLDTITKGMYGVLNRMEKRNFDRSVWKDTYDIYRDDQNIKRQDLAYRMSQPTDNTAPIVKNNYTFLPFNAHMNTNHIPLEKQVQDWEWNPYKNRFKNSIKLIG